MRLVLAILATLSLLLPLPAFAATYSTWNPSDKNANINLSGANLTATGNAAGGQAAVRSTVSVSTGKWYWEYTINTAGSNTDMDLGVAQSGANLSTNGRDQTTAWTIYGFNGNKANNSSASYGTGSGNGTVISVAIDMGSGKIWWGKDGVWIASGNPATGANPAFSNLSGTIYAAWFTNNSTGRVITANFGAAPFAETVPTGFNAGLCSGGTCAAPKTFSFGQLFGF